MEYTNEAVRRQDRLLDNERAYALLKEGEYGVLSMTDEAGKAAYGIPINYVWDGKDAIYLHCAPQGRKLRCIAAHPEVSFCVVGATHVVPTNSLPVMKVLCWIVWLVSDWRLKSGNMPYSCCYKNIRPTIRPLG